MLSTYSQVVWHTSVLLEALPILKHVSILAITNESVVPPWRPQCRGFNRTVGTNCVNVFNL